MNIWERNFLLYFYFIYTNTPKVICPLFFTEEQQGGSEQHLKRLICKQLTWELAYWKMELNLGMRVERYLQFCSIEIYLAACDYSEKFSGNLNTNKNMTSMFGKCLNQKCRGCTI